MDAIAPGQQPKPHSGSLNQLKLWITQLLNQLDILAFPKIWIRIQRKWMCFTLLNVFCMLDEPEFGVGLRRNGGEEMRGSEKYYLSCRKKTLYHGKWIQYARELRMYLQWYNHTTLKCMQAVTLKFKGTQTPNRHLWKLAAKPNSFQSVFCFPEGYRKIFVEAKFLSISG